MNDLVDDVTTFKSQVPTDHLRLVVRPKWKTKPIKKKSYFRLFSFRGHQRLNELISNLDLQDFYQIDDVHKAAQWLDDNLWHCFNEAFPIKQVWMSDHDPYWVTPKIKWLINQRRQNDTGRPGWKEVDAMTHRKQARNRILNEAFEPLRLNPFHTKVFNAARYQGGGAESAPPYIFTLYSVNNHLIV